MAEFDEATSKATMKFSLELAEVLAELKWVYSKISLQDFGRLQSRYAIRLYEIALSFAYLKGKQGNRDGVWISNGLLRNSGRYWAFPRTRTRDPSFQAEGY
jgi:plasmid replication initiation protein